MSTRLTIHRSTNGLTWSGPTDAAVAQSDDLAYDKNWLACDNGPASPFRGRCYLAYTLVGDRVDLLAVQRSDDGGRTWSAAVTQQLPVTGVIPVIQRRRQARADVLVGRHRDGVGDLDGRRRHARRARPHLPL